MNKPIEVNVYCDKCGAVLRGTITGGGFFANYDAYCKKCDNHVLESDWREVYNNPYTWDRKKQVIIITAIVLILFAVVFI